MHVLRSLLLCSSRPASDPDKLVSIEDAHDDLASDAWFANSSLAALAAPSGLLQELDGLGSSDSQQGPQGSSAAAGAAASGAASGAAGQGPEQRQRKLLAAAVGNWLAVYGGKQILGQGSRPKVRAAAAAAAGSAAAVRSGCRHV
jgi:hypothetical protein